MFSAMGHLITPVYSNGFNDGKFEALTLLNRMLLATADGEKLREIKSLLNRFTN